MNPPQTLLLPVGPRVRSTFNGFVGQNRAVSLVKRLLPNAVASRHAPRSLLLIAPSGWGKSHFARALAELVDKKQSADERENLHDLFGAAKLTVKDVGNLLLETKFAEFVLIDEAHALRQDAQRLLFRALDQFVIPAPNKEGDVEIAPFTLILATNKAGLIDRPLRKRLLTIVFEPYTLNQLAEIAKLAAAEIPITLTGQAASEVARTAQGTPRVARHRVQLLPEVLGQKPEYGVDEVRALLQSLGIDPLGLSELQRQYIQVLGHSPDGTCSFAHLSNRLGLDRLYLSEEAEPYLFAVGYVDSRGGRGRRLLEKGKQALEILRRDGWMSEEAE